MRAAETVQKSVFLQRPPSEDPSEVKLRSPELLSQAPGDGVTVRCYEFWTLPSSWPAWERHLRRCRYEFSASRVDNAHPAGPLVRVQFAYCFDADHRLVPFPKGASIIIKSCTGEQLIGWSDRIGF